jgi:hypothetical protein
MKLLDLPAYPAQDLPASALAAAATSSSILVNYLAGPDLKLKDLQSSLALRALALRALALRALALRTLDLPASMMATISHQLMIVPENRLKALFQRRPTDLERKQNMSEWADSFPCYHVYHPFPNSSNLEERLHQLAQTERNLC